MRIYGDLLVLFSLKNPLSGSKGLPKLYHVFGSCLLIIASACSSGGGDDDDGSDITLGENEFAIGATTDSQGRALVEFDVPSGTSKFAVTAESDAPFISVSSVTSAAPAHAQTLESERTIGSERAAAFESGIVSRNVPSLPGDNPVAAGSYLAEITTAVLFIGGSIVPSTNTDVTLTITHKTDSDFQSGTLPIHVVYVDTLAQEPSIKTAVRRAIDEMSRIYREQADIQLQISEFDQDGPIVLPLPPNGSDFYLEASASLPRSGINIFIGGDVESLPGAGDSILGISPSIPGLPIPSAKSAVAISLNDSTGVDGEFSSDEENLLGETLAHETAHYLGLFHPVELDFPLADADVDPLSDTPICDSLSACLNHQELIHNLMFAVTVTDEQGDYYRQDQLTAEQKEVLNFYILVN